MKKKIVIKEQQEDEIISTGYEPRKQQTDVHLNLKRFNVVLCHRRFGKTVFALNHIIDAALRCTKIMPRFAYIAPNFSQAKRVAWDYFKQYTNKIPGIQYNETELRVDFQNGARIQLLSAENPMALKGIYLDGVILDEFGDMNPIVWREVVRPTLSDRAGWAVFIGTVKGMNHFWDMHEYAKTSGDPEWYTAVYKASETGIIKDEELESARRQMTEEEYMQEYECDPRAGLVGAYFAREISKCDQAGRLGDFPYDPEIKVDTAWDLGVSDTTVIWFSQTVRGETKLIDYYEVSGLSLPEIVSDLQKKNYVLGQVLLPHDAKARDLSTGRSIEQLLYSLGLRNVRVIPRVGSKRDSINAAKMLLAKCSFDKKKCERGIKALSNYKRKWNEKNQCFDDSPLHDWSSNGADAFQQLALGLRHDSGHSGINGYRTREVELVAETNYNPFG